jgi:hypothetical protein
MELFKRLVIALAILVATSECALASSDSKDRVASKDAPESALAKIESQKLLPPVKVIDQGEIRLPLAVSRRGILLTLTRWGSTTLAFFDMARRSPTPVITKPTSQLEVSVAGTKVAYLSREGISPSNNHIEILDLDKYRRQLIEPAQDFAILGFSLSPTGEHLTFAQINLRSSRSHRIAWRIAVADLERQTSRISMTSPHKSLPERVIPIPIAWSGKTKEIYFQGLVPFQGMVHRGIWATASNGSGLRQIISEPSYTGVPRISPDGAYLAHFATKIDALPRGYIPSPGVPPANILVIRSLPAGEESVLSHRVESVFGQLAWAYTGAEILVSRREWFEGRFRDAAIERVRRQGIVELQKLFLSPAQTVTGIAECGPGALLWVEEGPKGATLIEAKPDEAPATLLSLPDGKIELIRCLGGLAR